MSTKRPYEGDVTSVAKKLKRFVVRLKPSLSFRSFDLLL